MNRLFRWLLFGLFVLHFTAISSAQTADILQTAETKLQFDVGPHSARLSNLQSGTEVWENRAVEILIPQAEMDGKSLPIVWNLKSSERHADKKIVSYVYDSSSPHLRLIWEWEVRSGEPIEHQNRDSREVQSSGTASNTTTPIPVAALCTRSTDDRIKPRHRIASAFKAWSLPPLTSYDFRTARPKTEPIVAMK